MITREILAHIAPSCRKPEMWVDPLNTTCAAYQINTAKRISAFLAQLAHESGEFKYTHELWGPTEAQKRYEGRVDLGNTQPGDGFRYRGRGLIQVTGRSNYAAASKALKCDFLANPDKLEEPHYAALSAGWYWDAHKLNDLADQDTDAAFKLITRNINGGLNGLVSRQSYWRRAKAALKGMET